MFHSSMYRSGLSENLAKPMDIWVVEIGNQRSINSLTKSTLKFIVRFDLHSEQNKRCVVHTKKIENKPIIVCRSIMVSRFCISLNIWSCIWKYIDYQLTVNKTADMGNIWIFGWSSDHGNRFRAFWPSWKPI